MQSCVELPSPATAAHYGRETPVLHSVNPMVPTVPTTVQTMSGGIVILSSHPHLGSIMTLFVLIFHIMLILLFLFLFSYIGISLAYSTVQA